MTTALSASMFGSAWADEPVAVGATTEAPARLTFAAPVEGLGPALDPASLEGYRGGDDSVENHVDIHGQVDGNTARNTVSGNNTLGGDAFSNASGISTVIQNSGSNVLIQNGMIVNVQFVGSGP
ncbi:hypothetical protein M2650_03155 [Luteimonas sp. SX5]|uniref:Holdfast attachment protein HfaA n=1 Tax=Luteimonas galliterrae TaxID=2940486 RepID=A0ABT0MFK7_9GAMM|nr:hypothetical protein [Luteimonas galliterrae]MCL1633642.1 hypothetical protein [Luteimonas galliterrae]